MAKDNISARRRMCLVLMLQRAQMPTHLFHEDTNGVCKLKPLLDTVGLNTKGFWKPYYVNGE